MLIDLKTVVDNYPDCMNSRVRLRNILLDLYPEEKRQINLALNVFESGIEQQIRGELFVDEKRFAAYIRKLNNEYGMHEQEAKEGICLWLQAYGISYVEPKEKEKITRTSVINRPPVEGAQPFSSGVASSNASDYETGIENGEVVIKKFMGFEEDEHIIPDRLNGYPVKAIGEKAFYNCKGIKKVIIPEGVTEIQNCAFMNCFSLEEVILPSTMEKLGMSAFACCNALREINLPDSICFIGDMAFSVTALERVCLPGKLRELNGEIFDDCNSLEQVVLPDSLTYIGERAFNACFRLKRIEVPSSVLKIDKGAFGFCGLEQIILHEGLICIEDEAFQYCVDLHEIKIPGSVKSIGEHVFDMVEVCPGNEKNPYGTLKYSKRDITIYCYPGSYGVVYARENNFKYKKATS